MISSCRGSDFGLCRGLGLALVLAAGCSGSDVQIGKQSAEIQLPPADLAVAQLCDPNQADFKAKIALCGRCFHIGGKAVAYNPLREDHSGPGWYPDAGVAHQEGDAAVPEIEHDGGIDTGEVVPPGTAAECGTAQFADLPQFCTACFVHPPELECDAPQIEDGKSVCHCKLKKITPAATCAIAQFDDAARADCLTCLPHFDDLNCDPTDKCCLKKLRETPRGSFACDAAKTAQCLACLTPVAPPALPGICGATTNVEDHSGSGSGSNSGSGSSNSGSGSSGSGGDDDRWRTGFCKPECLSLDPAVSAKCSEADATMCGTCTIPVPGLPPAVGPLPPVPPPAPVTPPIAPAGTSAGL